MKQVNQAWQDLRGNLWKTRELCGLANIAARLSDLHKRKPNAFHTIAIDKIDDSHPLFQIAIQQEMGILLHWLTKSPDELEEIIRLYLDETSRNLKEPSK